MTDEERDGLRRRELLKAAAATSGGLLLAGGASAAQARPTSLAGMNVLVLLTDQERAIQHFPRNWARENLPGYTRLQDNGLTFDRAVCNACMCSPSRSTLMTSYMPAQHGVKYTLEADMPADTYPQIELLTSFPNLATVMASAGYNVVYKGKFHCDKAAAGGNPEQWVPEDVNKYGWTRWDPPDAGADQSLAQAGGGDTNNDGRFMNAQGDAASGGEGALEYLNDVAPQNTAPFFMVVSLVNPHDVLFYPLTYGSSGYDATWLQGYIGLPSTVSESLATKPTAQQQFLKLSKALGPLPTPAKKRNYLNFYGNLMRSSDAYVVKLLNALRSNGLEDNTVVIRTADHGEMGMAHGGLRQKNFNMYEETLRVPLVWSNPKLWRRPQTSDALVSHVDFLPTLASLFGAQPGALPATNGVDYSAQVLGSRRQPQDYTVFTYDDIQSGQMRGPYPGAPNHIRAIREVRWKFAQYYDNVGNKPPQFEMYDLENDPHERKNLAAPGYQRTKAQQAQYLRLQHKLSQVEQTRLQPLPNTPESPIPI